MFAKLVLTAVCTDIVVSLWRLDRVATWIMLHLSWLYKDLENSFLPIIPNKLLVQERKPLEQVKFMQFIGATEFKHTRDF